MDSRTKPKLLQRAGPHLWWCHDKSDANPGAEVIQMPAEPRCRATSVWKVTDALFLKSSRLFGSTGVKLLSRWLWTFFLSHRWQQSRANPGSVMGSSAPESQRRCSWLMSQLEPRPAGPASAAALCQSSNFLCWPSPDSEKCWAGRSYAALEQRRLWKPPHVRRTVHLSPPPHPKAAVCIVLTVCDTFPVTKPDVISRTDETFPVQCENWELFWRTTHTELVF